MESELYTNIVQNMQFGITVWRLDNPSDITSLRLVFTNLAAANLTGIPLEDYIGRRITECFPHIVEENKTTLDLYAEVALSGTKVDQSEVYCHDEAIADSFFNVKVFPLPNQSVGVAFDNITQRKQAELALQQRAEELTRVNTILAHTTTLLKKRNDELDQFAYITSHDLKAPLRAIANLSEWLEEDLADQLKEENRQQMHLLRGRVQRMEALINGLLDYSRVERVKTPASLVNVTSLLAEVIDSLAPPPTFSIEIQPGMPTFVTKRLLLQQIFANLIGNGIKHHHQEHGNIKIFVRDKGNYYEFSVSDDGPGIATEFYQKIFVIFQTLESRDRKESTGVGLALVKKIVESEGGTINVESQIGVGSTFRFTWLKSAHLK